MAAQYDAHLTGHVLDERTGEHLPYVNIQIKGTNIGTVTDESGHYLLQDLPGLRNKKLPVRGQFHPPGAPPEDLNVQVCFQSFDRFREVITIIH